MKIAIFHNLPSGGAKRALYGLAKYLTKAGCSIDVFIPSTANETFLPLKEFARNFTILPVRKILKGIVRSTIRYISPLRISIGDLEKVQKRLANLINQSECDAVFVEQDRYTMSPFILKYLIKPHVYYCQQPVRSNEAILKKMSEALSNRNFLKRMWRDYVISRLVQIDKENALYAKTILTNSYFSREAILRAYGRNSFVSYLGVDTELFYLQNLERESYVISVGAIEQHKGFDFIIKSLGLLKEKIRPPLVIVGNTISEPYKVYLKRLAAEKGVKLSIINLISDQDLVNLYNKAKLCVYAPYLEPFGLVPLEAMACGTPVVAVKEGGVRESVIHGESGLLTERDEQEFADAISQLLLDKAKYKTMSKRGIDIIQNFWTMQHARQRLLQYLERVIPKSK